jgi:hypothetical protein
VAQNPRGNRLDLGIRFGKTDIRSENELVEQMAGVVVAVECRTGPGGQFGQQVVYAGVSAGGKPGRRQYSTQG